MFEWIEIILGFVIMGVLIWAAWQFRKMGKDVRKMSKEMEEQ